MGCWRIGAVLSVIVWVAASACAIPSDDQLQRLYAAYPGIRYSESCPTDWRIWGREFGGGASPQEAANAFIDEFLLDLLGVQSGDIMFTGEQDVMAGAFTALHFHYAVQQVPVEESYVTFLVRAVEGCPIVLLSGSIQAVSGLPPGLPRISQIWAVYVAANYAARPVVVEDVRLVIYTVPEEPVLTYRVTLHSDEPVSYYRRAVYVGATSGRVVGQKDLVYRVDIEGSVSGWATPGLYPDAPDNLPELMAVPGARISVPSGSYTYSATDGSFLLPYDGADAVNVTAGVANGQWANVVNHQGPQESRVLSVVPPGPAYFTLNPTQQQYVTAQVNALIHTTLAHDFVKSIVPTFPGIDIPITVNVNLSGNCYDTDYSGLAMNFHKFAPGECANTAYSTVIYHEYGHFAVDMAHRVATRPYHEGMADLMSAFLVNDPRIGLDFAGPGTGELRNLETADEQYPSNAEEHTAGQVIGGAFWKAKMVLAQELQDDEAALDVMRRIYLNSILLRPPAISPQVVIDVLVLDDDDGQIANGTPHWNAIEEGFAAHNLQAPPLPLLNFRVDLPPDFCEPDQAHSAWVTITPGTADPDLSTVVVHRSVDGSDYDSLQLGSENPIEVPFGPQPCGTILRWFISVDTLRGVTVYYPPGGEQGPELTVYSDATEVVLEDTFETDLGWTVTNYNLERGTWERGVPLPTYTGTGEIAQPNGDNPDDAGEKAYITFLYSEYAGWSDVDGGPTILTSPPFNLEGADGMISFHSWLFNDDDTDFLFVEISNDGGQTWIPVHTFVAADYLPFGPEGGRQWTRWDFLASDYCTPTPEMRVRFLIADQPNDSITEGGVDTFRVIRFACGQEVEFQGHVDASSFFGDLATVCLAIELRDPATGTPVHSAELSPDSAGDFTMMVTPGTYDVAVKGDRWLRVIMEDVEIPSGGPVSFYLGTNGDADGDNVVGIGDLNVVLMAFGGQSPTPADLNGRDGIDLDDLNIVLVGFGKQGPP
jgi:hypothetical protein